MGLSGLDGSVKQNTSARPSEASRRWGARVPVIRRAMLKLTTRMYTWVMKAGKACWVRMVNASSAFRSRSWFAVRLLDCVVNEKPGIGVRASAMALEYLMAFSALRASR